MRKTVKVRGSDEAMRDMVKPARQDQLSRGILQSTTYNSQYCSTPGHDFGGAARFQRLVGDPVRDVAGTPWLFLNADPGRFELLPPDALPLYQRTFQTRKQLPEAVSTGTSWNELSPISRLPAEIVHLLLAWLPLGDIAQLRLASRSIRDTSHVDLLPQVFWRSRFWVDFDMGFSLRRNRELRHVRDWRTLFFNYKDAHGNPQDDLSLKNRKRVWTVLNGTPNLIRLLASQKGMHGTSVAWDDLSPLKLHEMRGSRIELGPCVSGETTDEHERLMYRGCRESTVRSMLWPEHSAHNGYRVGVSVVSFNHQIFISGIRICSLDMGPDWKTADDRYLGLIDPCSEKFFNIYPSDDLGSLTIAVKAGGIVGLKLARDFQGCCLPSWMGDGRTVGQDVALGKLQTRRGHRLFAVAAGFDVSLTGMLV